ncbi:hypothetical protein [Chryseobacterium sp. SNU WT5]|uniref:hypothetical protein n=1 Tax=Chryseobacterium sp. SNU WT5 TaxID=2594269 RepID=UPI0016234210|nr:hypothetical protein [Chryseobacterium sp. SNU WT5]
MRKTIFLAIFGFLLLMVSYRTEETITPHEAQKKNWPLNPYGKRICFTLKM